jgi:hypothetical protein
MNERGKSQEFERKPFNRENRAVYPKMGEDQNGDGKHGPEVSGAKKAASLTPAAESQAEKKLKEEQNESAGSEPQAGEARSWHVARRHGNPRMDER